MISDGNCAREIAPALWESMEFMRHYSSTALPFYELYHRKHDSIASPVEWGGAYGSMALLEPILPVNYLATGGCSRCKNAAACPLSCHSIACGNSTSSPLANMFAIRLLVKETRTPIYPLELGPGAQKIWDLALETSFINEKDSFSIRTELPHMVRILSNH
jgi:hypothetical protein